MLKVLKNLIAKKEHKRNRILEKNPSFKDNLKKEDFKKSYKKEFKEYLKIDKCIKYLNTKIDLLKELLKIKSALDQEEEKISKFLNHFPVFKYEYYQVRGLKNYKNDAPVALFEIFKTSIENLKSKIQILENELNTISNIKK